MKAQDVYDALKGLPWQVARGKDKGLPPPTLGYDLRLTAGTWHCTLHARAYLMEVCDAMQDAAAQALAPLGFTLTKCEDGTERDTGIFIKDMAFTLREGDITVTLDGTRIGGVTGYEWVLDAGSALVKDLSGVLRVAPGTASNTLTVKVLRLDADAGQQLLMQKALSGARTALAADGTACAGYISAVTRGHDSLTADIFLE